MVELTDEARFLLARLNELEWSDLDNTFRDFAGHVVPSMERLQMLIDSPPIKAGEAVPVGWMVSGNGVESTLWFSESSASAVARNHGQSIMPLYASPQPEAYGVRVTDDEMVERAAKAIRDDINRDDLPEGGWSELWRQAARAALEAALSHTEQGETR